MAVLTEAISVVLRASIITAKFPGSLDQFAVACPNKTFCSDGELIRVGFMAPPDVKKFVEYLASYGIIYVADGKAQDLVVVDQREGIAVSCDWAEFGRVSLNGDQTKKISACRATGSKSIEMATPDGWSYENSLSSRSDFVRNGWVSEFMDFLRHENGLDVYRDLRTGKEVYVGRTGSEEVS